MERISSTRRLSEGIDGAVFIQETIPEDLKLKRNLFHELSEIPGDAILGSNAATIPIKEIAAGMKARRRIVGVHWIGPAYIIPAIEVIPSRWTAPDVVQRTRDLLRKAGKVPIVCKDIPGKIILRVQFAMLNEAIRLLAMGAASAVDIDAAVRLSTGLRLPVFGPLGLSDFVSTHRNTLNGMEFLYHATGDQKFKPPRLLKEKVKRGHLGIWAGKGWYDYDEGYEKLAKWRDRMLIESVRMCTELGIVPSRDGRSRNALPRAQTTGTKRKI